MKPALSARIVDAGLRHLAETATYTPPTPPGGAAVDVQGVFGQLELLEDVGDQQVSTVQPSLDVRAADISGGPLQGAAVVIRSVSYLVSNVLGPDDSGVAKLVLRLAP